MSLWYFSGIGLVLSFVTITLGTASFSKRLETDNLGSAPNILFIKSVNIKTRFIFQILGSEAVKMAKTQFGEDKLMLYLILFKL
jgi:hypothetical protein